MKLISDLTRVVGAAGDVAGTTSPTTALVVVGELAMANVNLFRTDCLGVVLVISVGWFRLVLVVM